MRFSNSLCVALVLVFVTTAVGHGAHIVDQQATTDLIGSYSIDYGATLLGQTFTPELTGLDFFAFNVQWSVGPANSYFVEIHDGVGATGTLLGTSQIVALPVNLPPTNVEFDFDSTVPLIPGNVYTALIGPANGGMGDSNYFLNFGVDTYAGGTAFLVTTVSEIDMIFQEGVAIVPEPSSLALAAVGLIGLAAWAWRKRSSV